MARLNVRLRGSTLLECIVAGIILLVCFGITMDTLTRITLSQNDSMEDIAVEIAFRNAYREYGTGQYLPGRYRKSYDWGDMEVEVSDYMQTLQKLTLVALPARGVKAKKYNCLVMKP